jgi:hypothetical protein
MLCVDEVITRKEVAVVFDDRDITASLPKDTECMVLPEGSSSCLLKYLHLDSLDILALPLVEDGAEKIAQSLSRCSTVAHTVLSVLPWLNQWKKANVWGLDMLEEPVDLDGMLDVLCMHYAQYIARDLVLSQEPIPAYCLLVGGVFVLGDTVPIMHLLRPVEAKAHGKALCRQKMAPVLIEESTVCLDTVGDALVTGLMPMLQRHDPPKVVQPQDDRLTTMPGKVDHRTGGGGNVLDNVFLKDGVGHTKRLSFWIEIFFLQVVTIVTVQVAGGTNGLGKNLKFAGSFNHCVIPNLQREYFKAPDLRRTRFFWSDYKWDNLCGSRKKETNDMRYVRAALDSLKAQISFQT